MGRRCWRPTVAASIDMTGIVFHVDVLHEKGNLWDTVGEIGRCVR